MADDILKNIPLPADLPENWTSGQIIAPTGAEAGLDNQHGYNYLMRQVNNAQRAATALNDGKLGLHDAADNGIVASGSNYVRFGDGTQICWAAYTDLIASSGKSTWTYPLAFSDIPAMVFQAFGNDISLFDVVGGAETKTTNATFYPWRSSASEFATYSVSAIAIGHWK